LAPGGKTWNTFLLLDEISEPLATTFDPSGANLYLPTPVAHGRVARPDDPEALIALDLDFVKAEHERSGLNVLDLKYGPWCGRSDNIRASYQMRSWRRSSRSTIWYRLGLHQLEPHTIHAAVLAAGD
jgi:hypothetical protein